ncbi:MAG: hypothetical protein F6J97_12205 [Leptolyngbya sp. SIO4C1]|nr:hypothetical protein [Leptolyngbya sp. SIO4C1]
MQLEFVPLLARQRELYALPRGPARFQAYLALMTGDRSDIELAPLVFINPMAKPHVAAYLEQLSALEAEAIAAQAMAAAAGQLAAVPGRYRVGVAIADDLLGGWTNRFTTDFRLRFDLQAIYQRGWLPVVLWVSEVPSAQQVYKAVQMAIYRAAYVARYGQARTLAEMIAQEGYALQRAGYHEPRLTAEDLAYTRAVIGPLQAATDQPTQIACLYGDTAARALGYPLQGLSDWAGLALALAEAKR